MGRFQFFVSRLQLTVGRLQLLLMPPVTIQIENAEADDEGGHRADGTHDDMVDVFPMLLVGQPQVLHLVLCLDQVELDGRL